MEEELQLAEIRRLQIVATRTAILLDVLEGIQKMEMKFDLENKILYRLDEEIDSLFS